MKYIKPISRPAEPQCPKHQIPFEQKEGGKLVCQVCKSESLMP
jgi:hypothetical protein